MVVGRKRKESIDTLTEIHACVGGPPAQEVDIEILTSSAVKAAGKLPEGVWFSNHPLESDKKAITEHTLFGFDPSKDFHEYRIDVCSPLNVSPTSLIYSSP